MNKELQNLLLENRGIIEPEEKEKFLNPSYDKDIYDPYLMKNMEKAVVRIFEAIEAKEKIIIYSDYDCDGIPGAVILHDFFKKIVYIPTTTNVGHANEKISLDTGTTKAGHANEKISLDTGTTKAGHAN